MTAPASWLEHRVATLEAIGERYGKGSEVYRLREILHELDLRHTAALIERNECAAAERAAIVAWLAERAAIESCWEFADAAKRIDAGEHRKGKP